MEPRAGARKVRSDTPRIHLRILGTTDLHGHILPYDYFADRPSPGIGLARIAALVRARRAEVRNTLLFDNGDFLHGNPLADAAARALAAGGRGPHPTVVAMNALGYDGGTLGNHDFDHGLTALRTAIADATFPITCANIAMTRPGDPPIAAPWVILDRTVRAESGEHLPLRIGLIGFAPPQITEWSRLSLRGQVTARDIVAAARDGISELQAAGADLLIALAHTGFGPAEHSDRMENAALPLAALDGIDALILGHTHLVYPDLRQSVGPAADPLTGLLHGTPTVMPGFFGSHLGVIDLELERGAGGWTVRSHAVRVESTARQAADVWQRTHSLSAAVIARVARKPHAEALEEIRRPIGETDAPLSSLFALVAPDATLTLVADAQRAAARQLLSGTPQSGLPLISVSTPFRAGGRAGPDNYVNIAAGPLLARHVSELYPYPNTLCLSELGGAELSAWLEQSAALFERILPGRRDQPLLNTDMPSYMFDLLDGLTWRIDPTRRARCDAMGRVVAPDAFRVSDIRYAGRLIAPEDRFAVVANSYRLGTSGWLSEALRRGLIRHEPILVRDVVTSYLTGARMHPVARPLWRFAALPGAAAWFDSAAAGSAEIDRIAHYGISPLGPTPAGFHRYRLDFAKHGFPRPIDSVRLAGYPVLTRTRTPRCPAAMMP